MKLPYLATLLLGTGVLVLLHQAVVYNKWFEPADFLHHENIAVILFAFASGILLTLYTQKRAGNP